jgi:arylsulfatase
MKNGFSKVTAVICLLLPAVMPAVSATAVNEISRKNMKPERIVLVTIDTLRADHLSCYGYPRKTSPFIDSLARDGILFEKLISSSSLTAPAHASIFTSLYPVQHNLLRNGQKLDPSFTTMAEILQQAGYETAGFAATDMHFKSGNLDQGFSFFDEPVILRTRRTMARQKNGVIDRDPETQKSDRAMYRQADATIDRAIEWIDGRIDGEKFFLWVHLYDPHMPYAPPENILKEIKDQSEKDRTEIASFLFNEHFINHPDFLREPGKVPSMIDNYDAEIRFVDREVQRLFNYMSEVGFNSNTLWVITADHGEGLGGHKFLTHGRLIYNEQIHIPLVLYFTSGTAKGTVVKKVIEQVDILPTIAELAGADLSGQAAPVEGASLVPLIKKRGKPFPSKYAFAHKWAQNQDELPEFVKERQKARAAFRKKLEVEMRQAGKWDNRPTRGPVTEEDRKSFIEEKFALQDGEFKYILNTLRKDELYNISEDPYEVNNLIGKGLKEEIKLKNAVMLKISKVKNILRREAESADKETIEKLKSLGYMQ